MTTPSPSRRPCKTCGAAFDVDAFYRAGGGWLSECKTCWKARVKARRQTDPKVQEYDRERGKLPHRRANARRVSEKWRAENPAAYRAQTALNNALRDGRIVRLPCQICNASNHIHAHHRDYARPLDVIWLCASCHHRLHALFPEIEGINKRGEAPQAAAHEEVSP